MAAVQYRDDVLDPIVILYFAAFSPSLALMDGNALPHRVVIVEDFLHTEGIANMKGPDYLSDFIPLENF